MGIFKGCRADNTWDPHDTLKREQHRYSAGAGVGLDDFAMPKRSKSLDSPREHPKALKRRVSKSEIGLPTNFKHTGHLGAAHVYHGKVDPDQIKRQMSQVAARLNIALPPQSSVAKITSAPTSRVTSPLLPHERAIDLRSHEPFSKRKHTSMRVPPPKIRQGLDDSESEPTSPFLDSPILESGPYIDPFEEIAAAMQEDMVTDSGEALWKKSGEAPWKVHGTDDWNF